MSGAEMWWNQVPGPIRLVNRMSQVILDGESVWLSGEMTWRDEFRMFVKMKVEEENSSIGFHIVDIHDFPDNQKIDDLIFSYDENARQGYLPAIPLVDYICKRNVLPDSIIWLYGINDNRYERWLEFSRMLARKHAGLRIICEGVACKGNWRGITELDAGKEISEFDTLLFAMTSVSELNWSPGMKTYASRLLSEIAGSKAEVILSLAKHVDRLVDDPVGYTLEIWQDVNEADIRNAVRSAQIKTLYPKVEQEREIFISGVLDRATKLLPFTDDHGNTFSTPLDMELRHLIFFYNRGDLKLSGEERNVLDLIYNARNMLSHRKIVSSEKVKKILR